MNIKKLLSIVILTIVGLSLINASENAIAIIKNIDNANIRQVGYELCHLYLKDNQTYFERLKENLWGTSQEKKLARKLLKDNQLISSIFSNKVSENPVISDLQEGCFDSLAEEILSHQREIAYFHKDASRCYTHDEIKNWIDYDPDVNVSQLTLCNETQLEFRNESHILFEKTVNATEFPIKLIYQLGRPERIKELESNIIRLFNDFDDSEEDL